ncbi:hypothetical protein F5887DRAFT_940536 [Amanita rubescens]|nr:hypothetical protein F5887DRAFT_940536 [Amanita rubescens]
MDTYRIPPKIDLTPRRHHGYAVLLFIMGTLLPPLAVAARFGIGKDFWLNILLTICGYIPGHGHNFYIQNIRNNKTHARTPKWAARYGLVDTSEIERKKRKSQWATRYNDRNPTSQFEGQAYEEGQIPDREEDTVSQRNGQQDTGNGELWKKDDESYYSKTETGRSGRWRYPANFDDTAPSKDRWARTEDAYHQSEERSKRKKSKKKRRAEESVNSGNSFEVPENPDGNKYHQEHAVPDEQENVVTTTDDLLNHAL